jgi:hypothetical protein
VLMCRGVIGCNGFSFRVEVQVLASDNGMPSSLTLPLCDGVAARSPALGNLNSWTLEHPGGAGRCAHVPGVLSAVQLIKSVDSEVAIVVVRVGIYGRSEYSVSTQMQQKLRLGMA